MAKVIVVLGGGVAGVGTALKLANLGYHVIIIERRKNLLLGSSNKTPCRLGLGFHYNDLETAKKYFLTTLALMREYPGFRVAENEDQNHPRKRGRYFVMKDTQFTLGAIFSVYDALKEEYRKVCKEDEKNKIFGEPDDFYRILALEEYSDSINRSLVSVGLETAECTLDWPKFRSFMLDEISKHPNIKIITSALAKEICRSHHDSNTFTINYYDQINEVEEVLTADAVVNCTWEQIEIFNRQLGIIEPGLNYRTNRTKIMVEINLPEELKNCNSMFFCFGPHCSLTNLGDVGFLTYEPVTNFEATTNLSLSEKSQRFLYGPEYQTDIEEKNTLGQKIIDGAAKYIPALKKATLVNVQCGIVRTRGTVDIYSANSDFHKRRESGVEEHQMAYVVNASMKLLYFLNNAEEVVEILERTFSVQKTVTHLISEVTNDKKELKSAIQQNLLNYPSSIFINKKYQHDIQTTIKNKLKVIQQINLKTQEEQCSLAL